MNEGGAVVRTTMQACLLVGAAAFLVLALAGHAGAGLALAIGFGIGSVNGYLARRTLGLPLSFWTTSLARLVLLGTVAFGVALLLDARVAWLVLLGVGGAQMVMAGVAFREGLRT